RPLVQGFAALVAPTETEINRTWEAQVLQPFQSGIGMRYPYAPDATVEAAQADIDQIFGPSGTISQFGETALGSLVNRRGNMLSARQWADVGINLRPELLAGYGRWVGASAAGAGPTMVFQILPMPAQGREYTFTVDGQQVRYRNTPAQWHTFQLPGEGVPGVTISAVTGDGRSINVFEAAGDGATAEMFRAASKQVVGPQHYRLSWAQGGAEVSVELRIISVVEPNQTDAAGLQLPALVAGALPVAPGPVPAANSAAAGSR
ncbi:MAG: type VI secretion IcmF C-terminal domain-containing protein, partial [Lysobacter spongiicola]|nr:type VI secretion IcmF C-terminal domain-containing protein [Lysobacter spongiicola]